MFVSSDALPMSGGIARCLDGWMTGLRELGHQPFMMALLPPAMLPAGHAAPRDDVEVIAMPERYLRGSVPTFVRKLDSAALHARQWSLVHARFIRRAITLRPDWVVFGVLDVISCLPLRFARAAGFRCASVAYGADGTRPDRVTGLQQRLARLDRVIAVSSFAARELSRWGYPAERTIVVHPSVALDVTGTAHVTPDSQLTQPKIASVARLLSRKGIADVLEAVARLSVEFPRLQYDVVGDGADRVALERTAATLGLGDRVRFHGAVSDEQRNRIVSGADLFVLTPRTMPNGDAEGFGIVYLEAGALGRPVIGSRSGGVVDVVRDGVNGVLVDPSDVEALAGAIRRLLRNPAERRHLGEAGRRVADEHAPRLCGLRLVAALEGQPAL